MKTQEGTVAGQDLIWQSMREEALRDGASEPLLASFLHATILNHKTLEDTLSYLLAAKLGTHSVPPMQIREVIEEALSQDHNIGKQMRADIRAVRERDPACTSYSMPLLYFKGFNALQSYRVAHWLYGQGRKALSYYLQNRISEVFGVDIHPAARLGAGIMIDHATGVVIGETAVVEDNVSMLHAVTLGGTGKETGDRHPKVREGVLIGAGAKILGNIEIGTGAVIGAGSVVLDDVPPHCTVVGVPARVVGQSDVLLPALEMDHKVVGAKMAEKK